MATSMANDLLKVSRNRRKSLMGNGSRLAVNSLLISLIVCILLFACTSSVEAINRQAPPSLKTVQKPIVGRFSQFIKNEQAAIALGKALFWDMQLGSDGIQACATCHFHAGADSRIRNQIKSRQCQPRIHTVRFRRPKLHAEAE